jgi:2'-5' RNA ligase
MASVRAFVAFDIGEEARARIAGTIEALRPKLAGVRWVAPEAIHVTLRFLGWSRPEALDAIAPLLRVAAARCAASHARIGGLGLFPERGAPRVLWLGLELAPQVFELQRACEQAAVATGYEAEGRGFRPHLTLGRWRERATRPTLPPRDLGATRLAKLVLFRSDLGPGGAVYTPLAEFPLAPA